MSIVKKAVGSIIDFLVKLRGEKDDEWIIRGIVVITIGGVCLYQTLPTLLFSSSSSKKKYPPIYAPGFPFIGSLLAFTRGPLEVIWAGRKAVGNCFTMRLFSERVTFLTGAEAQAVFFNATDEELDQADVYQFMTPIFGKGVVYDSPLKLRRQQYRALGESLKPMNLRKYVPIIAKETVEYLAENWGESGQVDIHHAMADLIIMTASATLLGPEIRNEMFHEMYELYAHLDKGLTPISVFLPYLPTPSHRKRDKARVKISALFSKIINARRQNPEKSSENIDMLQKLMEFKYKDGTSFTDDEICGMLIAALFAGQHTSSVTTSWTLMFLLDSAKKGGNFLQKALDEISILEKEPGDFATGKGIDSKVISEEEWLYACMKEALRVHPPIILLMRRVVQAMQLPDGTEVPVGDRVCVSNAIAQRLPEVFEDPNTYNPERWASWDISKLPKYSFIGFGGGIHSCLGEAFAFIQVRTILSVILSAYELELVTPFPEPDYDAMVVLPKGENLVRFKRRKPNTSDAELARIQELKLSRELRTKKNANAPASSSSSSPSPANNNNQEDGERIMYSKKEIAKHTTKDDLWIIVRDKVYEISNYTDVHQGGVEALLRVAGRDATKEVEGPQHPGAVKNLLERYYIGTVAPEFTIQEVAKHNKKDDAWIIVDGNVYDVSKFASKEHPGGESALLSYAGKDASEAFKGPQHPASAVNMLKPLQVGVLLLS